MLAILAAIAAAQQPVFLEEAGRCVIEAEHFASSDRRSDVAEWVVQTATAGYVGEGYVVARLAGSSKVGRPASWQSGCELTYLVEIRTPGTYYIALRCRGPTAYSDSVHVGLDGADRSSALGYFSQVSHGWIWLRGLAPLGELKEGVHVIHVRRRETLFELDRIMISTDESALPANRSTEPGAVESRRRAQADEPKERKSLKICADVKAGGKEFEPFDDWMPVAWANPATIAVGESGGKKRLVVTVAAGEKDKSAIVRRRRLELVGKTHLRFSVRNTSGEPVEIALAFGTAAGYFETVPVRADPGAVARMEVDLEASDFKCEATKWEFSARLSGLEDTRELYLLIYGGRRAASVEFSDFTLD